MAPNTAGKGAPRTGPTFIAPELWRATNPGHPLTEEESALLAVISTVVRFKKGEIIYREGDRADAIFNIITGVVKKVRPLAEGGEHIVAFLFPRDLVGLAQEGIYVNSAVAVTAATLYRIPTAALEARLRQHANLDFAFLTKICHDLRETQRHAFFLSKRHSIARLALFLQMLEHQQIAHIDGSPEVYVPMSRSDIAAYIGVTHEAVSRSFRELANRNVISLRDRQHLKVIDRAQLEALIAGLHRPEDVRHAARA